MKPNLIFLLLAFFLLLEACSSFQRRSTSADPESARQVYEIRQATRRYIDIEQAKADGYIRVSGYVPNMGYQFANPKFLFPFDLHHPLYLLYDERDGKWELIGVGFAVEIDKNPKKLLPFRDAEYLKRPSACHYPDGTLIPADNIGACPKEHPLTQAPLVWWHSNLWTMSAWVWYPNPNGVFALFDPLLQIPVSP